MKKIWEQGLLVACLACTFFLGNSAWARNLFEVKATVNPGQVDAVSANIGLSNAEDALRQLDTMNFDNLINSYTDTSPALAAVD